MAAQRYTPEAYAETDVTAEQLYSAGGTTLTSPYAPGWGPAPVIGGQPGEEYDDPFGFEEYDDEYDDEYDSEDDMMYQDGIP